MVARLILFLIIFASAAAVEAATYQWRDSNGVLHFTDDPDAVPQRYLNSAKELPSIRGQKKIPSSSSTSTPPATSSSSGATASKDTTVASQQSAKKEEHAKLSRQLEALQQGLPAKKEELAKLRRKLVVKKGRTPTDDEVKAYDKKRLKGTATSDDNPYINKSRLTTVGPARAAYYSKLQEVQNDEERIRQLQKELAVLDWESSLKE